MVAALAPSPLRSLVRAAATACSLLLVLAGCGGDETARPEDDYKQLADRICAEGNAKAGAVVRDEYPVTPPSLLPFVAKLVPIFRTTVQDLRAIPVAPNPPDVALDLLGAADAALSQLGQAAADPGRASEYLTSNGKSVFGPFNDRAAALGLSACAGAGSASSEGGSSPGEDARAPNPAALPFEKLAFVEAADAVCAQATGAREPLQAQLRTTFPPPLEAWSAALPQLVAVDQAEIDGLRELTPPPADAGAITALLDRRQDIVNRMGQAAATAAVGDDPGFATLIRPILRQVDDVNQEFRLYGFRSCGAEASGA